MSSTRWDLMQAIFERALPLEGAVREDYLDDACGSDAALRGEVAALLAADAEGNSLLDGIAGDTLAAREEDLVPGTAIGAWRVAHRLAEGGMGLVYLAERADGAFEQQVALKVIKRGMDSHEIVARFRAERQILARLQHPSIARLIDGGVTGDGRPWFAMEFVDGKPIDVYCDEQRLSVAQRLDLFTEVCAVVQFAHANLVVHRDLKPDNILITAQGDVKLLDFGIGKVLAPADAPPLLTRSGARLLTPAYASPEQLRGQSVSTATDIYSLGVVLFELLVGQRPVRDRGETDEDAGTGTAENLVAAFLRSMQSGAHVDLRDVCATRDTRADRLERQLRGDLEVICGRALQVEPDRRYASVEALAGDVRRHRAGQPVLARPDSVSYRMRKFVSRNRSPVVAVAAVVVLGSTTVAFYTTRLRAESARAQLAATQANGVSTFLIDLFRRASPQSQDRLLTARQLLDAAVAGIDTLAASQPRLYSNLLMSTGMVYRELGDLNAAEPQLRKLVKVNQSIFDAPAVLSIQAKSQLATTLQEKGEFAAAESFFENALDEARQLPGDRYAVAYCLNNLAKVRVDMARYGEAEGPLREAAAVYGQLRTNEDTGWYGTALRNLGRTVRLEGRLAEADSIFALSVSMSRTGFPKGSPAFAETFYEDAALQIDLGRLDSAKTLAKRSLAMREFEFVNGHATIGQSLVQLASIDRRRGDLPAAEREYARGDSILRKMLPPAHVWIADAALEHAEI
ncbi:MAG: protein kinase domain-containing protein, partial [Gemmatimonadaceae bacterium]